MLEKLYKWDCGEFISFEESALEKAKIRNWIHHALALIITTLLSVFSFDHPSYFGLCVILGVLTVTFYISFCFMDLKLFLLKQKEKGFEKC